MAVRNFKFPLQVSSTNGYFQLTETTLENIKQNVLLMFATDEGERMCNHQIGSRLRRFLFNPDTQSTRVQCENEINRVFSTFFPYLKIEKLAIEVIPGTEHSKNALRMDCSFSVKNLPALQTNFALIIG